MLSAVERMPAGKAQDVEAQSDAMRQRLLRAQFALQDAGRPMVVLITGMEAAGRGRTTSRLLHWLDARGVDLHARQPDDVTRPDRPWAWNWWVRLPGRHRMAFFIDGWVHRALQRHASGELRGEAWLQRLAALRRFEEHLADNGITLLKLWLHLSAEQQQVELMRRLGEPRDRWHLELQSVQAPGRYPMMRTAVEEVLTHTDTPSAPWVVIPAHCPHARTLAVADAVATRMEWALAQPAPGAGEPDRPLPRPDLLPATLDLSPKVGGKAYRSELDRLQTRLRNLQRLLHGQGRSLVVALEGMDAAGKGGVIRRLTEALDPRSFDVHPIAAPTDVERNHPWLWRFWTRMPRSGYTAIFDRTWYGRVLVERIEGFCNHAQWTRAWEEIRDFETQLTDHGVIVCKFWLQISMDEQLRRFQAREVTGYKQHKLTDEDWRNREKAPHYEAAMQDVLLQTDVPHAPWTLVGADDKNHARLVVLRTVCEAVARALDIDPEHPWLQGGL
jgi:polyphosphate:AMP phosphotransferase